MFKDKFAKMVALFQPTLQKLLSKIGGMSGKKAQKEGETVSEKVGKQGHTSNFPNRANFVR